MHISPVRQADLPELVEVARAAFIEDDRYKPLGAEVQGPPGHDLIETHLKWLQETRYLKLEIQGDIAGACNYEIKNERGEICGIFVHPDFMNRGVGSMLLKNVFELEPIVKIWWLETPDYAIRNHQFYRKNGFRVAKKTEQELDIGFGFLVFEYHIQTS